MKLNVKKLFPVGIIGFVVLIVAATLFYLFAPMNKTDGDAYVYVDKDDNVDSIAAKLDEVSHCYSVSCIKILARHTGLEDNIRTGRFCIDKSVGSLMFFRKLRNGQQDPVRLTVPSVRTLDRLAEELSAKLMMDKEELMNYFANNDSCNKFGLDTATIVTLFIPNTYEVYWNISAEKLLKKMQDEKKRFWNDERMAKAGKLNLTPEEVMTLASIIDEETANNAEKPMIAGMYYNRLQKPMPLQADPTIKFALKDFAVKRIYNNMLHVKSPYNTYINEGLPPGPIRVASVAGIDAVLNMERHDYLYMCAKEDFSGTHNFARTYEEHLQNAAKYSKALNERNIGKY